MSEAAPSILLVDEQRLRALIRDEIAAILVAHQPEAESPDSLLTVDQAATLTGCTAASIRAKIARRQIPTRHNGASVRIRRGDLLAAWSESENTTD